MSYCRTGWDSDVHVIQGIDGHLECLGCRASGSRRITVCPTRSEMIEHLLVHRTAGHKVPERTLERLHAEQLEQREDER